MRINRKCVVDVHVFSVDVFLHALDQSGSCKLVIVTDTLNTYVQRVLVERQRNQQERQIPNNGTLHSYEYITEQVTSMMPYYSIYSGNTGELV